MPLSREQMTRLKACFPTLSFGATCSIVGSYFDEGVTLGEEATVNSSRIGAHAIIGPGAKITGARIGNHVRIGAGARILAGITIGNHCVIEPDAVVTRDVNAAGYAPVPDPDGDLPLEQFLLEKLPLIHVLHQWKAVNGDATLRVNYPLAAGSFALDVGGYQGDWAHDMVQRHQARVEVFEPVAGFAAQIRGRFRGDGRVTVHDFGLAGRSRTEEISLSLESSSVVRASSSEQRERIRLVAAREIIERIEGDIAILKINIEGCEYELLEHLLDEGLIGRVRYLQVQFHDFVANARPRRRAIRQRLKQTHREQWNYPFIWESWERK